MSSRAKVPPDVLTHLMPAANFGVGKNYARAKSPTESQEFMPENAVRSAARAKNPKKCDSRLHDINPKSLRT
jgi:hypothetical protein